MIVFILLKNVLGIFFIIGGIAMLALPGQGILTIIQGYSLWIFPANTKSKAGS